MRIIDKQVQVIDDEYREMLGLMISVAVVFIIGALALGVYKDHVYKSSVSGVLTNIVDTKTHFHELYAMTNAFPKSEDISNYLAGSNSMSFKSYELINDEESKVTAAVITVGVISDLPAINDNAISFIALKDSTKGALIWLCGYATHKDYPFTATYNKTAVKREHLPEICRDNKNGK